jgi:hypothetical protein
MGCGCGLNGVKGTKRDREREEAAAALKKTAPAGTTIFYVVKHRSKTGYGRSIAFYVVKDIGGQRQAVSITSAVAKLWGYQIDTVNNGVKLQDDGRQTVAELGHTLYGRSAFMAWEL